MTIRVITPLYNAKVFIPYCLASINMQSYKDFKCYICDDMSTDGSVELITELIKDREQFELIENAEKMYPSGNHYHIVNLPEIDDEDICISVDGDDWLAHENVFENIIKEYEDKNLLMTYGSFKYWDGNSFSEGFCQPPSCKYSEIRKARYTTTHLRTFKAKLFRNILHEDFLTEDKSSFIPMAGDLAFMFPMLEMAGEERVKYLSDVSYVYNVATNQNEYKVDFKTAQKYDHYIRNKQPYKQI